MGEIGKQEVGELIDKLRDECHEKKKKQKELKRLIARTRQRLIKNPHLLGETLEWISAQIQLMAKNRKFHNFLKKLWILGIPNYFTGVFLAGDEVVQHTGKYYLALRPNLEVQIVMQKSSYNNTTDDQYHPDNDSFGINDEVDNLITSALLKLSSEDPETRLRFFFETFGVNPTSVNNLL